MKCPLSNSMVTDKSGELEFTFRDCLKEECAWWDTEEQSCDPSGLRHHLKSLIAQLWVLTEKMPHEEQFRR